MMRARELASRKEVYRLEVTRIAGIQDGYAIAEHVTDIEMLAARHDLDAVRPPADVAVGNVLDSVTDAFRRNRPVLGAGEARHPGDCRHSQQTPQVRAPALHGFLRSEHFFAGIKEGYTPAIITYLISTYSSMP